MIALKDTNIMSFENSKETYGSVSRALHWGMAIVIVAMFGVGLWMRTLTYYSPYYKIAPDLHKSVGLVLLALLVFRLVWRLINTKPDDSYLPNLERIGAHLVHWVLYGLMFVLMLSGYLISTADGRPIMVFGFLPIPSVYQQVGLEDLAGFVHEYLAYGLIALASFHALAALKHHFIDRDITLQRMLGKRVK